MGPDIMSYKLIFVMKSNDNESENDGVLGETDHPANGSCAASSSKVHPSTQSETAKNLMIHWDIFRRYIK